MANAAASTMHMLCAHLVSQLVDEDYGAATLAGVAGNLAQCHTHQARLAADLHSISTASAQHQHSISTASAQHQHSISTASAQHQHSISTASAKDSISKGQHQRNTQQQQTCVLARVHMRPADTGCMLQ
jgi:hypothetical protein